MDDDILCNKILLLIDEDHGKRRVPAYLTILRSQDGIVYFLEAGATVWSQAGTVDEAYQFIGFNDLALLRFEGKFTIDGDNISYETTKISHLATKPTQPRTFLETLIQCVRQLIMLDHGVTHQQPDDPDPGPGKGKGKGKGKHRL